MDLSMIPHLPDPDVEATDHEVTRAAGAVRDLLTELAPRIRGGEYGLIIGEDTSGRIPALLVHHAVDAHRRGSGRPGLPIYFLQSSREGWGDQIPPAVRQGFERVAPLLDGCAPHRALIVTDNVGTGRSVLNLVLLLAEVGVAADVATLAAARHPDHYRTVHGWPADTRLTSGRALVDILWNRGDITGLDRAKGPRVGVLRDGDRDTATLVAARQDAARIGRRLAYTLD